MLATLILMAAVGQTPQAQWYPITNRPGWEGWGVPNGSELLPQKWRKISDPKKEWVMKWEEVPTDKKPTPPPAEPAPVSADAAKTIVASATAPGAAAQPAAAATPVYDDPYGFVSWLNGTRASYGLSPVGHDPNLSSWAAENNNHQVARGMGHFVMGPARRQNAAMGSDPWAMWMNSRGHRAALLDPTIRWIGIAALGSYWTFNAN